MASRFGKGWRLLKLTVKDFSADNMTVYAAALAYRSIFSIFPFLIFLTALLGFLGAPQFFDWMREQAAYMLPPQAMDAVERVLAEVQKPRGGLMSVGIALAIYSASVGVLGTMDALNVAYDVKERRPMWKRILVSILYTLALAIMLIVAAGLMISGPAFLTWLTHYVGLDELFIAIWTWIRWPIAILLLMLALALVYWAAPNVKQPFRFITPGSVLAVTVWVAASLAFAFYVQNFANYNQTYGSLGAVVILLFYFYLSAAVLLFGAELNAVIARDANAIEQA
jgi:membrane protein